MQIDLNKLKRLAIITAIVVIPIICVNLINVSLTKNSQPVNQEASNPNPVANTSIKKTKPQENVSIGFFAEFRMERERVRSKQIELLREIANNQTNTQKVRDAAAMRLVQVADTVEKEMQAETLIRSKGYQDCAVIVKNDQATIVLPVRSLDEAHISEITGLTSLTTGLPKNRITIAPRENYR